MTFVGLMLGIIVLLRLCPDLPISRYLHKMIVEQPMDRLSNVTRIEVVATLILIALLMAGGEVLVALGSVDFALAYATHAALYLDFVVISAAVVVAQRVKSVVALVVARIAPNLHVKSRARKQRSRSLRKQTPPSNDDEHHAVFLAVTA